MKKISTVLLVVGLVLVLVIGGLIYHNRKVTYRNAIEQENRYTDMLNQARRLIDNMLPSDTAYTETINVLDQARSLYPDRPDADRLQTYALYKNGKWEECVEFGMEAQKRYEQDANIRLTVASAQFELRNFQAAADGFSGAGDLEEDHLRDYAVCLGRSERIDEAEEILSSLTGKGVHADVMQYVNGEVLFMQENYISAEEAFLNALQQTADFILERRCYVSLGELYRDCAELEAKGQPPIERPARKAVDLLTKATSKYAFDTVIWEMLAMAYYQAYKNEQPGVPEDYLIRSADGFSRLIQQGIKKEYLYSNLFTIYYEMSDYTNAEQIIEEYKTAFPLSYVPHAHRVVLLIEEETPKPSSERNYDEVVKEFETATDKILPSDDTQYYQQAEGLIESLRKYGYIS